MGETREVAPISISEKEKPKGKKKGEFEFLGETSSLDNAGLGSFSNVRASLSPCCERKNARLGGI